ncbi:MAG: alpha-N-arabinofuranosidase, partial [Bacteroidia bacterium]
MIKEIKKLTLLTSIMGVAIASSCQQTNKNAATATGGDTVKQSKYLSPPLISAIYTADPSAHIFNGKIYIYPSHDV